MRKLTSLRLVSVISVYVLFILTSGSLVAQVYQPTPGGQGQNKLKALKVAFITNRLALTSQEAQGFWPIYNEKQQKMQTINQQRRKLLKEARDGYFNMTDADMEQIIKQLYSLKQQELDLEKQYYQAFKTVIPVKKIALLMKVEQDFKAEVLKQAINRADE